MRRLRALRRGASSKRVLRVRLLLRERLRALSEALVEGRAEGASEVGWVMEADRAVVREVLVTVEVRLRRRRRRALVVRARLHVLIDDGLVAAFHEDRYVPHVGVVLVRRLLVVGAHVGVRGARRVGGSWHRPLAPVVRIDARVGGALLAEVDRVPEPVLRETLFRLRSGLVLGLCGGGVVLRRRRRRRGRGLLRGRLGRGLVAVAVAPVPMWREVLSELCRDVVEGESVEAAEVVAEICNDETLFYTPCKNTDKSAFVLSATK